MFKACCRCRRRRRLFSLRTPSFSSPTYSTPSLTTPELAFRRDLGSMIIILTNKIRRAVWRQKFAPILTGSIVLICIESPISRPLSKAVEAARATRD